MKLRVLMVLILFVFPLSVFASVEHVTGKFLDGTPYRGEVTINPGVGQDGERIERVSLVVSVEGVNNPMRYNYDASDHPIVKVSSLGFIAIVTNVGGMDGSINVNYVFSRGGKLVSGGEIDVAQSNGQASRVDVVDDGAALKGGERDNAVAKIFKMGGALVLSKGEAFINSGLIFLSSKDSIPLDKESLGDKNLIKMIDILHEQGYEGYAAILSKLFGLSLSSDKAGGGDSYIKSDKSHIYSGPEDASKTRAYLVKNDKVTLTGESKNGYRKFSYINAKGGSVQGWVRCEDVAGCH